jgi:RNA polymerase sigma-70 factor, ECF subfamily
MLGSSPYLRLVSSDRPASDEPPVVAAFRRNVRVAHQVAFRILGRQAEVDDLLQDLYVAAQRDLRDLSNELAVRKWFIIAAVRMARRRARRQRLLELLRLDEPMLVQVASPAASPEQQAEVSALYGVLDMLPLKDRIAWTLRHLEGLSLAEVATACGCSLATAKRRIAAAAELIEGVWNA